MNLMQILILTPNTLSKVTNLIFEALLKNGIEAKKIALSDIRLDLSSKNFDFQIFKTKLGGIQPDGAISRGIGINKIKKIFFRVDIYRSFEYAGIPIINSSSCLEKATNKMLSTLLLKKYGIPTPETIICENYNDAIEAFSTLGRDVIVKPLFGSKGRGVTRVMDEGFAEILFYHLAENDEPYYIQKYYEHENKDIRALVIDDQVIAAMKRVSKSWRTNIAKGAIGYPIHLDSEAEELAIKSSIAVEGQITGVDLIRSKENGYSVVEVNAIPGIIELQKTTKIDLANEIAKYCINEFKK